MPLGHTPGNPFDLIVELWKTVGYGTDENGQPYKNPTDHEVELLRGFLDEGQKYLNTVKG